MKELFDECPMCGQKHFVEIRTRISCSALDGIYEEYPVDYCVCNNTGEEFTPSYMIDNNTERAKQALREKGWADPK